MGQCFTGSPCWRQMKRQQPMSDIWPSNHLPASWAKPKPRFGRVTSCTSPSLSLSRSEWYPQTQSEAIRDSNCKVSGRNKSVGENSGPVASTSTSQGKLTWERVNSIYAILEVLSAVNMVVLYLILLNFRQDTDRMWQNALHIVAPFGSWKPMKTMMCLWESLKTSWKNLWKNLWKKPWFLAAGLELQRWSNPLGDG